MAVPSNTLQSYAAVGNREDLSDEITMISPVDTIFYGMIPSKSANAVKHEWQTDALAAAASNAQLEGDDAANVAVTPTTRLYNNCQIQRKVFQVSGTQEKVNKAGRTSEVDYQKAKFMKELAKDIEYAFLREVRVDGAAGTASKMRGALNWTTTNLSKASDATLNADGTVTAGTARTNTEAILQPVLQTIFTAGGDPSTILCDASQKQKISAYSQATSNYRAMVEGGKLDSTVDVYVSDFGALKVVPHRLMPASTLFIVDAKYWAKATLRPTFMEELAKTGDSKRYQIIVEHTLEAKAENANGRITDLT